MLTSVSRAAAGRVLFARASSKLPQPLAPRSLALRPAAAARSFSAVSALRNPEAAAKKTTANKAAAKRPAVKKPKAEKKVKEVAPKPKAVTKVLTPEEKEKLLLRNLRTASLVKDEPPARSASPWNLYIKSNFATGTTGLGRQIEAMSAEYKNLSPSELESLQTTAAANRVTNAEHHSAWVRSHAPEAIYLANLARARLNRMTKKRHARLVDDRLPKRPQTGYSIFVTARVGDVEVGSKGSRFAAIADEWKALSAAEKAQYVERSTVGMAQYKEEFAALKHKVDEYIKATGLKITASSI